MENKSLFDEQDLHEMFGFLNIFASEIYEEGCRNQNHFTWNGEVIAFGKAVPVSSRNADYIIGKGLDYVFVDENGIETKFNFYVSNETFSFYNPYKSIVEDFSNEWSTILFNNHTEEYAKYFISLYKQRIGFLKDTNRRLGSLIGKKNRLCDNNKNAEEKKCILKQCKEIACQRRQNNKTISSCKDKIHSLQEVLLAVTSDMGN